jgi:hypothetical protein
VKAVSPVFDWPEKLHTLAGVQGSGMFAFALQNFDASPAGQPCFW